MVISDFNFGMNRIVSRGSLASKASDFGGLEVGVGGFKPCDGSGELFDDDGASSAAESSTTFGL